MIRNIPLLSGFVLSMTVAVAAFAATTSVLAADVVVVRGNRSEVVSTDARADGGVTVIRGRWGTGRPGQLQENDGRSPEDSPRARGRPLPPPAEGGVATGGDSLWSVDAGGRVRACWLQGTGYVNSLKVVCTR